MSLAAQPGESQSSTLGGLHGSPASPAEDSQGMSGQGNGDVILRAHDTRLLSQGVWRCLYWAKLTDLGPVLSVVYLLGRNLEGILNAIVLRATNGLVERIDSRIQRIKRLAYGFRNRERFRQAPLFHLGCLDLYPASMKRS